MPGVFIYTERTDRWVYVGGEIPAPGKATIEVDRLGQFAVFAMKPVSALPDTAGHWARDNIRTMAVMGAVGGYPDGTFKPNADITRAEFVAMLVRSLGIEFDAAAADVFRDAPGFGWAAGVIGAAHKAGLITGFDGRFEATRQITRAEAAVILARVVDRRLVPVGLGAAPVFADTAAIPAWAREGVVTSARGGLVRGLPGNVFHAANNTTRAEVATMLFRLVAE